MSTVAIRKKSLYTWEHFYDDRPVYVTNVFNINNGGNETFNIVEYRGAKLDSVPIANVTVYDDTGAGTPETFATFSELNTRLGILKYPPFRTGGEGGGVATVQQGDGIEVDSTDADNPIVSIRISSDIGNNVTIGTDGGIYVSAIGGVDEFIELTDTPSTYVGQATKKVVVKSDETGLEFVTDSGGGVESVTGDGVDNTDPLNPVLTFPTPAEIGAEDALGFTPENLANKVTDFTVIDDVTYPSTQAVSDILTTKQDALGFTPENVANKATSLTTPDNTKYPTTQLISDYLVPTASTGNSVSFDKLRVYNYGSPATGNITEDLTGAKPAIVQVFYHQQATAFTVPAGWVNIGGVNPSTTLVNKFFVEWITGSVSHYWIAQIP